MKAWRGARDASWPQGVSGWRAAQQARPIEEEVSEAVWRARGALRLSALGAVEGVEGAMFARELARLAVASEVRSDPAEGALLGAGIIVEVVAGNTGGAGLTRGRKAILAGAHTIETEPVRFVLAVRAFTQAGVALQQPVGAGSTVVGLHATLRTGR